jgi:hypothetical protein
MPDSKTVEEVLETVGKRTADDVLEAVRESVYPGAVAREKEAFDIQFAEYLTAICVRAFARFGVLIVIGAIFVFSLPSQANRVLPIIVVAFLTYLSIELALVMQRRSTALRIHVVVKENEDRLFHARLFEETLAYAEAAEKRNKERLDKERQSL